MNFLQTAGADLVVIVLVVAAVVAGLKAYLPKYLAKKAENQATKEDMGEITRTIETVKQQIALSSRQREIVPEIVEFIDLYKRTPATGATEDQLRALEAAYHRLVIWAPPALVEKLSAFMNRDIPLEQRPDPKDLLLAARKEVLGNASGTFTKDDVVHLVGYAGAPAPLRRLPGGKRK